jgi:hypothetical protein
MKSRGEEECATIIYNTSLQFHMILIDMIRCKIAAVCIEEKIEKSFERRFEWKITNKELLKVEK